jgi:hypothetical protein
MHWWLFQHLHDIVMSMNGGSASRRAFKLHRVRLSTNAAEPKIGKKTSLLEAGKTAPKKNKNNIVAYIIKGSGIGAMSKQELRKFYVSRCASLVQQRGAMHLGIECMHARYALHLLIAS